MCVGGIQRYIERFVDGGFFGGKNFVFDERVAVPPPAAPVDNVVGTCLLCHAACDSYRPRMRCAVCRLLVLICPKCEAGVRHLLISSASIIWLFGVLLLKML